MIVIHHNKDLDGFSSGAICKLRYPDAKLIGWDYKDPIPDLEQFKDQDIIMIDISFPTDVIKQLVEIANHLTIIDHHISFAKDFYRDIQNDVYSETMTACEVIKPKLRYVYQLGIAACEIGWNYLFPDKPIPYAITLLGRYDTWRQKEGDWEGETLPFQYYMRTVCTSAETFPVKAFTAESVLEISRGVEAGKLILKYQEQQDMLACERSAFEAFIDGKQVICLNTRAFSSNTLKSVYNPLKHSFMVGFEFTGDKWSVSLRSDKEDVDVSLIAKARGGGGHKAAAGFECDTFEDIFK